jgi:C1A family cysteine protease
MSSASPLLRGGKRIAACALSLLTIVLWSSNLLYAQDFDWRNILGQDFITPVKDQGNTGMCWAFASTAELEALYKITRNDPTYDPDLSEQQMACAGVGDSVAGGYVISALGYFESTGLVTDAQLPFTGTNSSPNWPLSAGWQNST